MDNLNQLKIKNNETNRQSHNGTVYLILSLIINHCTDSFINTNLIFFT